MFLKWSVALSERVRELRAGRGDSGEGPVPYLIMVGIIAVGAVAIAGIIIGVATDWAEDLPPAGTLPDEE